MLSSVRKLHLHWKRFAREPSRADRRLQVTSGGAERQSMLVVLATSRHICGRRQKRLAVVMAVICNAAVVVTNWRSRLKGASSKLEEIAHAGFMLVKSSLH